MTLAARLNGARVTGALAFHRGLAYGDGAFRTCLIYGSYIIGLDKQLKVLSRDARRLGLRTNLRALKRESTTLAARQRRAVLKILLLRAGDERGYRARETRADRLLLRFPAPAFPESAWTRGIKATRSAFRLADQPALAGIKHLNRLEQVLASRAWRGDETIVCDALGRPHCGTRSNVFWVRDGVLRTPALDRSGVAGFMRGEVLALAKTLRVPTRIGPGSWKELQRADEAFVTNSLIGIWPLARLEAHRWPGPGPVTRALMQRLDHPRLVKT